MKIGVNDYDHGPENGEEWTGGVSARTGRGIVGLPVRKHVTQMAEPPDPQDGELYVYPYSERDDFGRRRFFLYWRGDLPAGADGRSAPCRGLRGQVYHADDRQYVRDHLHSGARAFWWPTGDEITRDELGQAAAR